jgi:hypothetical protein
MMRLTRAKGTMSTNITEEPRAWRQGNGPLLTLNIVLVLMLAGVWWGQSAGAQNANVPQGARARGEYTMVAGRTLSGGSDAVYVLDGSNQELLALRWDAAKQGLAGIGYRSLSGDAKAAPAR